MNSVIKKLHDKCISFVGDDKDGNKVIIDPIAHVVIGAHYAMSHVAAALIVCGQRNQVREDLDLGLKILEGILNRWEEDSAKPDFHNDFNHFALCIIWRELSSDREYEELCSRIKQVVLSTKDSAHFTINWLSMRSYVNYYRYVWTKDEKYLLKIKQLYRKIAEATNEDGFIEDLLPKGKSFNLQYDLATVAVLDFLNNDCGLEEIRYNFKNEVTALVNACDPQGDVNYLGRGCNQIFAWGLWLYLLKSQGLRENYLNSLQYLKTHIDGVLENDNLLLNEFSGAEKMFWWDYHYSSVYLGHLYLWLVLAYFAEDRPAEHITPDKKYGKDSGIDIVRNEKYFLCIFSGRKHYLAEAGPIISNLLLNGSGYVTKGAFGPWLGSFGNKYRNMFLYFNYFGPLQLKGYGEFRFHRLYMRLRGYDHISFRVLGTRIAVREEKDALILDFSADRRQYSTMNMPIYSKMVVPHIKVLADGKAVLMRQVGTIRNQYGEIGIWQTNFLKASQWSVVIQL